jgi:hypothetical protein
LVEEQFKPLFDAAERAEAGRPLNDFLLFLATYSSEPLEQSSQEVLAWASGPAPRRRHRRPGMSAHGRHPRIGPLLRVGRHIRRAPSFSASGSTRRVRLACLPHSITYP